MLLSEFTTKVLTKTAVIFFITILGLWFFKINTTNVWFHFEIESSVLHPGNMAGRSLKPQRMHLNDPKSEKFLGE